MGEHIEAEAVQDLVSLVETIKMTAIRFNAREGFNHDTTGRLAEAERELFALAARVDELTKQFEAKAA